MCDRFKISLLASAGKKWLGGLSPKRLSPGPFLFLVRRVWGDRL